MESINENDFRYPGPKPQTKEAGIVMLADSVEAASRALTDPTPSRINSLVQRITNNIFLDGQLEECELTLKDLQKIQESFNRILTAIFHQRIDYPLSTSSESPKKRNDEDLDSKSAKHIPLNLRKIRRVAQRILTELGLLEAEISLLFVNDLQIQTLNRRYLCRDKPTNVLAFP